METDDNTKDNLYKILQNDEIARHDIKLLIADFNLQIYKSCQGIESAICLYVSANIIIVNDSRCSEALMILD